MYEAEQVYKRCVCVLFLGDDYSSYDMILQRGSPCLGRRTGGSPWCSIWVAMVLNMGSLDSTERNHCLYSNTTICWLGVRNAPTFLHISCRRNNDVPFRIHRKAAPTMSQGLEPRWIILPKQLFAPTVQIG